MADLNSKLISYIQNCLISGMNTEQVSESLLLHGWRQETINEVLAQVQNNKTTETISQEKAAIRQKVIFELWLRPIATATIAFFLLNIYTYFYYGMLAPVGISLALSGAATICIGTSFALSAFGYYFNFLDKVFASRRNFGLLGYFLALFYSFMLLFLDKARYFDGFFENLGTTDFILGLSAMAIFTIMASISNNWSLRKLGSHRSHFILRFGYLAYLLLILRAIAMEGSTWILWLENLNGLPPIKLIVVIFASSVILLRFMLEVSLTMAKRKKASQVVQNSGS